MQTQTEFQTTPAPSLSSQTSARPTVRRAKRGAAAAAHRLDKDEVNGSSPLSDPPAVVLKAHKCGQCWGCPQCGRAKVAKMRATLLQHFSMFKDARLMTLTMDREKFEAEGFTPEQAFEFVTKKGLIRRIVRLYGMKKAFCVVAPHPNNPEWVHWHLVFDMADLGGFIDLKRLWHLWRDKWGIGGLDVGIRPEHKGRGAWNYCFQYANGQTQFLPSWVGKRNTANGERSPRTFETYGELRNAVRQAKEQATETESDMLDDHEEQPEASKRDRTPTDATVAERIDACAQSCVAVANFGQRSKRFLGAIDVHPGALMLFYKLCPSENVRLVVRGEGSSRWVELHFLVGGKRAVDVYEEIERDVRYLQDTLARWKQEAELCGLEEEEEPQYVEAAEQSAPGGIAVARSTVCDGDVPGDVGSQGGASQVVRGQGYLRSSFDGFVGDVAQDVGADFRACRDALEKTGVPF